MSAIMLRGLKKRDAQKTGTYTHSLTHTHKHTHGYAQTQIHKDTDVN